MLVFKLESQTSVQLQMHHLTSTAELLLQALGSLPFCGKCTVQRLGWSFIIPVFFRHLCLVSRVGQRLFTKICRFCLLLTQGCPVWSDSAGCWEKGQLVGGPYLLWGHFVKPLGKALLGRQDMTWEGCPFRSPTGWFDNKMWFGKQISLCLLHPAMPCQTAKCWGYSGASDFTLTCFIHLVLLQLLIKHNICVPEMSKKHRATLWILLC